MGTVGRSALACGVVDNDKPLRPATPAPIPLVDPTDVVLLLAENKLEAREGWLFENISGLVNPAAMALDVCWSWCRWLCCCWNCPPWIKLNVGMLETILSGVVVAEEIW